MIYDPNELVRRASRGGQVARRHAQLPRGDRGELAEGTLPGGKRYVARDVLLARRVPQGVDRKGPCVRDGLRVETANGTPIVEHGGATFGYRSNMLWLPEHGVGAVILTNGDLGGVLHGQFQRKLLELLFDGKPEAEAAVTAAGKNTLDELAVLRKDLSIPPDPAEVGKLAPKYQNAALGELTVRKTGTAVQFDLGEWKVDVANRKNPDGTVSFLAIARASSGWTSSWALAPSAR